MVANENTPLHAYTTQLTPSSSIPRPSLQPPTVPPFWPFINAKNKRASSASPSTPVLVQKANPTSPFPLLSATTSNFIYSDAAVSSAMRRSMSGTARSWSSSSSFSLLWRDTSSAWLQCKSNKTNEKGDGMKEREKKKSNLLLERHALLRVELSEHIPALAVELQDVVVVLPQRPSVRDGHERDSQPLGLVVHDALDL